MSRNTKRRIASRVSIAVSGRQRSRSSTSTTMRSTFARSMSSLNDFRNSAISCGTLGLPDFSLSFLSASACSSACFRSSGSVTISLILSVSAPNTSLTPKAGSPVRKVKASLPPILAAFSTSMFSRMRAMTSSALPLSERFSMRPFTTPSIRAILASSKPWNCQPLNLIRHVEASFSRVVSTILRTLDLPAPQSPWTPIVIGWSDFCPMSFRTVMAMASLLRRSTFVSWSLRYASPAGSLPAMSCPLGSARPLANAVAAVAVLFRSSGRRGSSRKSGRAGKTRCAGKSCGPAGSPPSVRPPRRQCLGAPANAAGSVDSLACHPRYPREPCKDPTIPINTVDGDPPKLGNDLFCRMLLPSHKNILHMARSHMWNGPADKSAQQQIPHRERCSHMSGLWARSGTAGLDGVRDAECDRRVHARVSGNAPHSPLPSSRVSPGVTRARRRYPRRYAAGSPERHLRRL